AGLLQFDLGQHDRWRHPPNRDRSALGPTMPMVDPRLAPEGDDALQSRQWCSDQLEVSHAPAHAGLDVEQLDVGELALEHLKVVAIGRGLARADAADQRGVATPLLAGELDQLGLERGLIAMMAGLG